MAARRSGNAGAERENTGTDEGSSGSFALNSMSLLFSGMLDLLSARAVRRPERPVDRGVGRLARGQQLVVGVRSVPGGPQVGPLDVRALDEDVRGLPRVPHRVLREVR